MHRRPITYSADPVNSYSDAARWAEDDELRRGRYILSEDFPLARSCQNFQDCAARSNSMAVTCAATLLKFSPSRTTSISPFSFKWDIRAQRSGTSSGVCPGNSASMISGHLGLKVIVRSMSGCSSLFDVEVMPCILYCTYRSPKTSNLSVRTAEVLSIVLPESPNSSKSGIVLGSELLLIILLIIHDVCQSLGLDFAILAHQVLLKEPTSSEDSTELRPPLEHVPRMVHHWTELPV